jgi:hypothetical protein
MKFRVVVGTLIVGLVGSVGGVLVEYAWVKPRLEEPGPSTGSGTAGRSPAPALGPPSGLTSGSASGGEPVGSKRYCRDLADAKHAPVDIAPCTARSGDQVEISARVVSHAPAEVTVHVWLYDSASNRRDGDTLTTCRLTFTAAGQTRSCGPHSVRPDWPSRSYRAATGAQEGPAAQPLVWGQYGKVGILSGTISWP